MRRLLHQNDGASVIEYGLIAGLVALGLIGALVSTRGSLAAIFGSASAQMTAAQGTAAAGFDNLAGNPALAQAGFWQGKTLAATPVKAVSGTKTTWSYSFSDGTTAQYSTGEGGPYNTRLYVRDPATNTLFQVTTNSAGAVTADIQSTFNAYGQVAAVVTSDVVYGDTWTGTNPNRQHQWTYSYSDTSPTASTSGPTNASIVSATAAFLDRSSTAYQDLQYFGSVAQ